MPKTLSGAIGVGAQDQISHPPETGLLRAHRPRVRRSLRLIAALLLALILQMLLQHARASDVQAGEVALPQLNGAVSILADPSSSRTLADILEPAQQAQFRPVPGSDINLGYVHTAAWIRLTLTGLANTQAVLSLAPNFLDDIDVYTSAPGTASQAEDFIRHEMGDHRPPPRDGLSGLDNAVRLELAAGTATHVYIRIFNTNSSTHLNLQLSSVEARGRQVAATASTFGIWIGGMGALLVTQLVFFYFDRKAQYALVASSTLGIILIYMGNLGYSHVYLFPDSGTANDIFIGFSAWAGLAASALAYASILDLRNKSPLLNRLYQFTVVVGIIGAGFAFAGHNTLFGPVGTVFSIVMTVINMSEGLRQTKTGGSASRLRAAAFSALCVGATMSLTQRLGLLWMPQWTVHSYGIASFILTILLTGSLAVRLRDAEALNNRMREDALQTAQEARQIAHRLVEERTRELVLARAAAEDALLAEKQSQLQQVRFLEVISHQVRTPLAAIRSSIDSIGLALAAGDGANRGRIDRIRRAIARLVEMLEINLARSRLQGPSFKPQFTRINAGSCVSSAFQRARDLLNEPDIRLTIDPQAAGVSIIADAGMLELALVNLLENAVKYTALKGSTPIDLTLTMHGMEIAIEVIDRGIGIPRSDLPHVFAHATRGSNAENVEGSGVGLFLVEKIVRAHQGRVLAESVESEGATVRIMLPIV